MQKTKTINVALIGLISSLMIAPISTSAHEPRLGISNGKLNLTVGWRVEPAFAGQANAFDVFVTDPNVMDDSGNPVAIDEGVNLKVKILFLSDDTQNARILRRSMLIGNLRRDRSNLSRYNISVLPTRVGAYGFRITGDVRGIKVDEIFICRGGTQNPDGRSFGCVEKIQRFPRGRRY
ncbi:MAG: hypothetical protein QNJ51_16385 [Calothrix sp. MO_167.B12]|nr:hypothetical protein [Calothrix sp. MO_167.B12]